jgi:hypothetical protein
MERAPARAARDAAESSDLDEDYVRVADDDLGRPVIDAWRRIQGDSGGVDQLRLDRTGTEGFGMSTTTGHILTATPATMISCWTPGRSTARRWLGSCSSTAPTCR